MTNRATRRARIPTALKKAKLPEASLDLCLAQHLIDEYDSIPDSDSLADPNEGRREALKKDIKEATLHVTLRALGSRKYDELTALHPPRTDVASDREAGLNEETFKLALVRACMVEPVLDEEPFLELVDVITTEQWVRLWATTIRINRYGGQVPFSRGD